MGKILGQAGMKFLSDRGIDPETSVRYGIYTAESDFGREATPSERGNILVFPFSDRGHVVSEKYRGPGKKFWQTQGGRRTFWNADALDDPALVDGRMALVITEGEIDALSAIQCGFPLAVSVPDGAPPVPDGEAPENLQPLDPKGAQEGKFEFLWNNRERLRGIKRFIIAADKDRPGQRLAAELVRRLSPARCLFVTYPDGCKDLNDVLVRDGPEAVALLLNAAKPYPVRGLYRLSDYPDVPPVPTFSTGWHSIDRNLLLFAGEFMVVTGIPGSGKSKWVLNLLVNMAEGYGWRAAVFSPEMPTVPHLRDCLRRMRLRTVPFDLDRDVVRAADSWINDNIVFIDADPTGRDDQDFDLDWIIDKATDAVLRDGIRIFVIDPWNEIEHARERNETMTDYIGRSIRALKRFGQQYGVVVIVVAHPTKEVGREGKARAVTLYDIENSAHWFNKPDHGVVIDRPDPNIDEGTVRIAKVRFEESGEKGTVRMRFNRQSSRFEVLDAPVSAEAYPISGVIQ